MVLGCTVDNRVLLRHLGPEAVSSADGLDTNRRNQFLLETLSVFEGWAVVVQPDAGLDVSGSPRQHRCALDLPRNPCFRWPPYPRLIQR